MKTAESLFGHIGQVTIGFYAESALQRRGLKVPVDLVATAKNPGLPDYCTKETIADCKAYCEHSSPQPMLGRFTYICIEEESPRPPRYSTLNPTH